MNALASFAPIMVLSIGGLLYLLFGQLIEKLRLAGVVAVVLIALATYSAIRLPDSPDLNVYGIVVNAATRFLAVVACLSAFVSVLAVSGSLSKERIVTINEYYYLTLTSLCGALIMVFAADFLTMFIGVEVASLALYCLCAARVDERRSSEASMKYFLLGCFSSGILLYGIALWYGATGGLSLNPPTNVVVNEPIVALSFLMILVGIAFKIGLAPFHFWVPDVYQGAPTSVTTFMSSVVKVAAVTALLKISATSFGLSESWFVASTWIIAVLAMTAGNLAALQQASVKRMLAYSSVAQAGYMLIGIVVAGSVNSSIGATIFYLIAYCAMTIGAFGCLSILGPNVDDIKDLRGLVKRSPFLSVALTLFFLALAGLPPAISGLMGKVYLFSSAISAKYYGLAVFAALNSALACAYYFRVPMAILFQESTDSTRISVPFLGGLAIVICAAAVVVLGVFPEPLLHALQGVSKALVNN